MTTNLKEIMKVNPMKDNRKNIKERDMQPTFQKGMYGEELVKHLLVASGYSVQKNPNSMPDFTVSSVEGRFLAEVKCTKIWQFNPKNNPIKTSVYSLRRADIDSYINCAKVNKIPCVIFIVDEERGAIFYSEINNLLTETSAQGYEFPRPFTTKKGVLLTLFPSHLLNEFVKLPREQVYKLMEFGEEIRKQKEAENFEEEFDF